MTQPVPPMATLPNNLADFPSGKSWLDADPSTAGRLRHVAARLVLLLVVGGLVGFGGLRLALSIGDQLAPGLPPPSLLTPPQDETEPTPTDAAAPNPDDAGTPALIVTGLLGNQDESQNWAGYAATEGGYTSVSGTWTVPDIGLGSPAGIDAAWVGIGGVRSRDLIQAGTQRTVLQNGATQQEVWVELLPRSSETVPLKVGPGETIRVSIEQQGPETWLVAFTNITSGQMYQVTKKYASSHSSVEWVEEAPSAGRRRTLPLDNFGTVRFSQASAVRNTEVQNILQTGAHRITMITPTGLALAEPSALNADGDSFSVTRTSTPSPRRGP